MTDEKNDERQQGTGSGQNDVERNRNTTLDDPGAAVADYGRSEGEQTSSEGGAQKEGETRQGNSSIPLDNEDTIGIP